MRAAVLAALLLPALLFGIACLQPSKPPPTADLAITIPWPDQEQAQYAVFDRKHTDKVLGQQTLTVSRQGDRYELAQHYEGKDLEGNEGTDDSTVFVNAQTLKPVSFQRKLVLKNQTQEVKGDYDAVKGIANITEVTGGKDRPVPLRLGSNYYDNDTALFLWRTIPFAVGYTAAYRTVLTGNSSQAIVQIEVTGKEEVTVPAGTFQAWKLEIRSSGVKQFAWFADTPEHPMVQYNNSIQLFQLTALQ
jgi:hypothetical protein